MFQLRIALIVILLAGAGGGYLYVTKHKKTTFIKIKSIKLESVQQRIKVCHTTTDTDLKKLEIH